MEFLLTSVDRSEHPGLLAAMRKVRTRDDAVIQSFQCQHFTLFVLGEVVANEARVSALGGSAFVGDRYISNFRNLTPRSVAMLRRAARHDPASVTGAFTLVTVDRENQRFEVLSDPLSAYPCFRAEDGGTFAVSNNIYFVRAALAAAGVTVARSLLPFLADFALGSAYEAGCAFEGISLVAPGESVRGGRRLRSVTAPRRTAPARTAYPDIIAGAAARLQGRVTTLREAFRDGHVYFDITGGMDSRMVVAAIAAAGPPEGWTYRTLFDQPHPDGAVADWFAETYGLARVAGIPADSRQMSVFERMRFETFAAMGAGAKLGTTISPPHPDVANIHGGYGEIAGASPDGKRFLSGGPAETYQSLRDNYLGQVRRIGLLGYFSPAGADWVSGLMAAGVERYRTAGVAPRDVPVHYYNEGRLRSHFGMISRQRAYNRNYPDLLYDMALQDAALCLEPKERVVGKVNFDMIDAIGGDATLGVPLANTAWDASLFSDPERMRQLRKEPVTAASPPLAPGGRPKGKLPAPPPSEAVPFVPQIDPNIAPYDVSAVAPRHRNVFFRQRFLEAYLPGAMADSELGTLLDRDRVAALVSAPPDTVTGFADGQAMQMLCECAIWHHGIEMSMYQDD